MTTTFSRRLRDLATASATASLLAVPALAADPIVGNWQSTVELFDCAGGSPLGPPFTNMTLFNHGGTLTETNVSNPAERGPAFGSWRHDAGAYVGRFDFLRFAGGNYIGTTRVQFRRELGADRNTSSGTAEFDFLDPGGNVVFSACSRFTSVRLR